MGTTSPSVDGMSRTGIPSGDCCVPSGEPYAPPSPEPCIAPSVGVSSGVQGVPGVPPVQRAPLADGLQGCTSGSEVSPRASAPASGEFGESVGEEPAGVGEKPAEEGLPEEDLVDCGSGGSP